MGDDDRRFDTRSVIAGIDSPRDSGDVITPIHVSSTYQIPGLSEEMDLMGLDPDEGEYVYSRISNPTRNALENKLASLEGGEEAFAFASGTAAVFTTIMATVRPGDHVVAFDDLYGGTKKMLQQVVADRLNIAITFVDARDTDAVAEAVREETELILETPTNPLLKLCDIESIAEIADAHGIPLAVDNTFASPCFQRPLELGADVSVASTTKYLNGHSDSVGGAVVLDDGEFAERIQFMQQVGMG
ncbi:MAG: PLP-dependent aspartate aminotransferase family protein, partial [Candidatus Nanohaloarchaea archaeon]|nr:PLP-dependent aspartate aminotransferase family protein [Candidatus Nanohaloarchaea archaeon]